MMWQLWQQRNTTICQIKHSKEAPFFVMFGRDAVTNIGHITVPRYRYMGTEDLILDLEIMSNIYQCQIINLQAKLDIVRSN